MAVMIARALDRAVLDEEWRGVIQVALYDAEAYAGQHYRHQNGPGYLAWRTLREVRDLFRSWPDIDALHALEQQEAEREARIPSRRRKRTDAPRRHARNGNGQAVANDPYKDLPPQVAEHARQGRKIEAIKDYRAITGVGLKEAKEIVEDVGSGRHGGGEQWSGRHGGGERCVTLKINPRQTNRTPELTTPGSFSFGGTAGRLAHVCYDGSIRQTDSR